MGLRKLRLLAFWIVLSSCDRVFGLTGSQGVSLSFDNTAGRRDLDGFPVMVPLDSTKLDLTTITNPATDLRFIDDETGADLPFEIERWDPSGESIVWLRVPHIVAGTSSEGIRMLSGADVRGAEAPHEVWLGYDLVLHGTGTRNSASADFMPTLVGARLAPGAIADGVEFMPTGDQRVTFANGRNLFAGWPTFTLEMWIQPDYPNAMISGEPQVLDQGGSINGGRILPQPTTSPDVPCKLQLDLHFTTHDVFAQAYVFARTWSYVVFTYDGQNLFLYRNGLFADIDANPTPDPLEAATGSFILGGMDNVFRGGIDEVRVSRGYRDADWVYAQYLAMTRRFISYR